MWEIPLQFGKRLAGELISRLACKQHVLRYESGANVPERKPKDRRNEPDEKNEEFDRFEDLTRKLPKVPEEELREKWAG
jgi:hypothetical protein